MSQEQERLRRLDRILKVQRQKRLLEEWRLVHLREERAAIDRTTAELIASLGTESALHGLFVGAKVNGLRRNDVARRSNADLQAAAETRIRAARRSEKSVEKVRGQAAQLTAQEDEASALRSTIEGHLARSRTSFE
jgi:hypothetical protein